MKLSLKGVLVTVAVCSLIIASCIFIARQYFDRDYLLDINSIAKIEAELGEPYRVIDSFPSRFGSKKFSVPSNEQEVIYVFEVRSFAPLFLIVRFEKGKDAIVDSFFESS